MRGAKTKALISLAVMHQSFVSPAPQGPGIAETQRG